MWNTFQALRMASVPVLPNEAGPCVDELGKVLKKIGAERQAYHGGSFNGNHTNKCLKVSNSKIKIAVLSQFRITVLRKYNIK